MATYFPYMRQDKHFEKYDSFSSKHIIKLFREFDKIIAIDPHLHRIKNLRELSYKAESVTINRLIADYIAKRFKDKFTILGPDAESSQWDSSIAKMLDRKVVILQKTRMGDKNKARAVGKANGLNPISIVIPCHRVIGHNGDLVGFGGGVEKKSFLLKLEQRCIAN